MAITKAATFRLARADITRTRKLATTIGAGSTGRRSKNKATNNDAEIITENRPYVDIENKETAGLTREVKDRIRLEEQYRTAIRAEEEKQRYKRPGSVIDFFGTALGIAIMTSILVPLVGGLYSHIQQNIAQRASINQQVAKLTGEYDWRVSQIEFHKDRMLTVSDPEKVASTRYIADAILGEGSWVKPIEPSLKGVPMAGIVSQLNSLGYADSVGVSKTIRDIEYGGAEVTLKGQPENNDHIYNTDTLGRQIAVLRNYRSKVTPQSGFWNLLW